MVRGVMYRLVQHRRPDLLPALEQFDLAGFLAVSSDTAPMGKIADDLIARLESPARPKDHGEWIAQRLIAGERIHTAELIRLGLDVKALAAIFAGLEIGGYTRHMQRDAGSEHAMVWFTRGKEPNPMISPAMRAALLAKLNPTQRRDVEEGAADAGPVG